MKGDNEPFSIAQTPREVVDIVEVGVAANSLFVELTVANPRPDSPWNGRPLFIDPCEVRAVTPPYEAWDEDDD